MNVSFDAPVAETLSIPLCSVAAFEQGLTALEPYGTSSYHSLWRNSENRLLSQFSGNSVDQMLAVRDRTWFSNSLQQNIPLHQYLRRIAADNLQDNGQTSIPKILDPSAINIDARSRLAWRWLTFYLPKELLLVGTWTDSKKPSRVDLLSPSMQRVLLERGFAEAHLHMGAGLSFELLWIATLARIAWTDLQPSTFESPGAFFENGCLWPNWLLRAAIGRYFLASFLADRANGFTELTFGPYLMSLADRSPLMHFPETGMSILRTGLQELASGRFSQCREPVDAMRSLYCQIASGVTNTFPEDFDKVWERDPIARFFPPEIALDISSDMRFTYAGLQYMESCCDNSGVVADSQFAKLFWQANRIRNLFYQHIVHRPLTPGLQWFIRFYGRLSAPRKPIGTQLMTQSAARVSGVRQGLRALELRTSPSESLSDNFRIFREVQGGWGQTLTVHHTETPCKELGVVLHFTKDRGGGFRTGVPEPNWQNTHADPSARINGIGYRYAQFFETKRREAVSLGGTLLRFPDTLRLLRGIDICSDELAVPTWVFTPLYRYLDAVGKEVSSYLTKVYRYAVPPLRKTVHVGEDFVHLIGGLRAVSDAIKFLGLNDGDRIGHGMALGVNPITWAQRAGRIAMTKEQRLFDLVWEWSCFARGGIRCDQGRMAFVDDNVRLLSKYIFQTECTPQSLSNLIEDLHNERRLRECGFPNGGLNHARNDSLVYRYLTEHELFRRGHETMWVIPIHEVESIETLQQHVRNQVVHRGIVIEINPSSNLLLGNMADLGEHPLWRLRSPIPNNESGKVRVCIGSDDPITFACSLPEEYMLVHDALVLAGLGADQADQWLETARSTGLTSRFTMLQSNGEFLPTLDSALGSEIPPILYG